MTAELPAPLVPADLDVSRLRGFMLDTDRLLASELLAISTGEEFKAAVRLWCWAWKQVPAGSLPPDDRILAAFSGAAARWPRVRAVALRGFIRCSDGRLYHPVLCADALRAARARQQRAEAIKARYSKQPPNYDTATAEATAEATGEPTAVEQPNYGTSTSTGTGRDGTKEKERKKVSGADAPSGAGAALPAIDPKRIVFGECLAWLAAASGKPAEKLRSMLGKWVRDFGDVAVIAAFQAAARDPPAGDAIGHLTAILTQRNRANGHGQPSPQAQPVDRAARARRLVERRAADLRGDLDFGDRADADPALPAVPRG